MMSPRAAQRASPLLQPPSPLSSTRMESLQIPSQQRRRPNRSQHSAASAGSMRLPSLPRFHPANFPSQSTSSSNTPGTGPSSPQPPMSPNQQQRQYSDAQRQLLVYHQQLLAPGRGARMANTPKPVSPRLIPLGSPGPVTPLELEQQAGGYFAMGARTSMTDPAQAELVDKMIRDGAMRPNDLSPNTQPTSVGGR